MTSNTMNFQTYNQIQLGECNQSRPYLITEKDIIAFASQWNPEPYHVDKQKAEQHPIGKLFASGVHLLSICTKLGNEIEYQPEYIAGLGWDDIRFSLPAFVNDVLTLEQTYLEKRRSKSKPGTGIVKQRIILKNQNGKTIVSFVVTAMLLCHDKMDSVES